MSFVHSITATPPARYDGQPWNRVRIEESADGAAWAPVETQNLTPLDAAPTTPLQRQLTTTLATIAEGFVRVVWLDADGDESPPSDATRVPATDDDGYPTLDSLIAASTVAALTDAPLATQRALRSGAIAAVEVFARQSFVPEGATGAPVTKLIDGSGSQTVYLPKRLATLVSVTIDGASIQPGLDVEVHAEDTKAFLKMVGPLGVGSWVTRVRRVPGDPGPLFRADRDNVAVAGVWGWTEDEWAAGKLVAVEEAIRLDMEDQARADANPLAATVRSARALGLSEVSQGGLSASLRPGEAALSVRAKRRLVGLRWTVPSGSVA